MTHNQLTLHSLHQPLHKRLALLCMTAIVLAVASLTARAVDASPEFGGQCAEGLAEGQHVMTKCTTTWTDKDGKTYCFSNDSAKKVFLESPVENLQRARSFAAASNVEATEKAMQEFTCLSWGVRAFHYAEEESMDEIVSDLTEILKQRGFIKKGDVIINTGSLPISEHLPTNLLKISKVE